MSALIFLSLPPTCAHCGKKPVACHGGYEGIERPSFACDECCGHGNEDGRCIPVDPSGDPLCTEVTP